MLRALLLALLVSTAPSTPAAASDVAIPLLDVLGYVWEEGMHVERAVVPFPDVDHPRMPEARPARAVRRLSAVGELVSVESPLMWDPRVFSLSWYLRDLELVEERFVGDTRIASFAGGRFSIHADGPYEPFEYGTRPPNESVPSTFSDGFATYLDGRFDRFVLTFDTATGLGTIEAAIAFTGGTALPWVDDPEDWRFDAVARRGAPMGYAFQVSGGFLQKGTTTAARASSWGSVKARYR
jgi:hypothetical protein